MYDKKLILVADLLGVNVSTLPSGEFEGRVRRGEVLQEVIGDNGDLSDEEFAVVEPLLAAEPKSADAISNRNVLNALLWQRSQNRPFTHIPPRYGSAEAIRKRMERFAVSGVWDRLGDALADLQLTDLRRAALQKLCVAQGRRGDRIRNSRRVRDQA